MILLDVIKYKNGSYTFDRKVFVNPTYIKATQPHKSYDGTSSADFCEVILCKVKKPLIVEATQDEIVQRIYNWYEGLK